ncbi:MAG: PilZ domain-containing protein [Acidobacteria bacterium]|nr:PilZ domain-containing protein [Acidobacteriota bacterium]MCA1608710.1 PilZ domain-containing protein [Acidobacteriota bacterium]
MDRRKRSDRRETSRHPVTIDVEWEGPWGRSAGTLSDISERGCFVLSSGNVEDGTVVKLFLPLSDGMKVQFATEVSNHLAEVGFAARFIDITPAQKDFLRNFVEMHGQE